MFIIKDGRVLNYERYKEERRRALQQEILDTMRGN